MTGAVGAFWAHAPLHAIRHPRIPAPAERKVRGMRALTDTIRPAVDALKSASAIIGGTIGLACCLGIAMDLVTANVAVEYFTVHHPKLVDS